MGVNRRDQIDIHSRLTLFPVSLEFADGRVRPTGGRGAWDLALPAKRVF